MPPRSWLSVLRPLFGSGGQTASPVRPPLRFLWFLIALLVLFPVLLYLVGQGALYYDQALAAASQKFLSLSETTPLSLRAGEGERIFVGPATRTEIPGSALFQFFIRTPMHHVNLALLWALFLATPGISPICRAKGMLISSGTLFSIHVLLLLAYVKYIQAVRWGEYASAFGPLRRFLYEGVYLFFQAAGWMALPLAIWAGVLVPVFLKRRPPVR